MASWVAASGLPSRPDRSAGTARVGPEHVPGRVHRVQTLEQLLHTFGQGFVGGVHAGKQGVAA